MHFFLANFFMLVTISLVIFDLQECAIPQIKAKDTLFWPYFLSFLATINNFWDRKQWSCFILFTLNFINEKNCKICNFLKQQIFSFFIISLVIFDLQNPIIPHIKAETISFRPYFLSFLAKSNIFWARKQWSCLIFFYPDFSRSVQCFVVQNTFLTRPWDKKRMFELTFIWCTKCWSNGLEC